MSSKAGATSSWTSGVLLYPHKAGDRSHMGAVAFNCVISEEHVVENEVTGYPTETGFVVADHAIKKNRRLTLDVIVGNTVNLPLRNTLDTSGLKTDGVTGDGVVTAAQAHEYFQRCCMEGLECRVSTIYGIYNHAIITKYFTKQDVNNASVLAAKLEIQDIYKVPVDGVTASKGAVVDYPKEKDDGAQRQIEATGGIG